MTAVINHSVSAGGVVDDTATVDGAAWDANHVITGVMDLSQGGTNTNLSATGGAGQVLKQTSAGAAVTVGTVAASEIAGGAALTKANDTNVTLSLGGTPAAALLAATSITVGWTGTLAETRGGTGQSTLTQGDLLYSSAANTLAKLAKNTSSTRYLSNTGTNNNPDWAQVNLSNGVTGVLPVANGGTGDSGAAWSTWTPTVTSGSGTITTLGTVTARYKQIGKTVFFSLVINITTNGTGATNINFTLPVTGNATGAFSGSELAVSGKLMSVFMNTTTVGRAIFYDGTYPGANGAKLVINGTYEGA